MAKNAGMKYIVITAKHHDGFALFDTAVSDWDIVDATPYGKDLLKPLAEAARKHDIKLGFVLLSRAGLGASWWFVLGRVMDGIPPRMAVWTTISAISPYPKSRNCLPTMERYRFYGGIRQLI